MCLTLRHIFLKIFLLHTIYLDGFSLIFMFVSKMNLKSVTKLSRFILDYLKVIQTSVILKIRFLHLKFGLHGKFHRKTRPNELYVLLMLRSIASLDTESCNHIMTNFMSRNTYKGISKLKIPEIQP